MSDNNTRIRNLSVAGGLALVAALLTMVYVSHVSKASGVTATGAPTPVLVATRDLSIGTTVSTALGSGAITLRRVPASAVAEGAVANTLALRGQVVLQPIFKGEQVTIKRFGPSGAQGVRGVLRGDLRILRVPGDADQLLAGTVRDGDRVDVLASVKVGSQQTAYSKVVLRNLLVLGAPADGSSSQPGQPALSATVQLTDAQAQTFFYVLKNGDWSFILRPATRPSDGSAPAVTAGRIVAGS